MTVLLDEGAPAQAAQPFVSRGHRVLKHADMLSPGASDEAVIVAAISNRAVLVATDRDMQGFTRRFGTPAQNEKYPSLDLLFLGCRVGYYAPRLDQAMEFIELEWAYRWVKPTRRLWLNIEDNRLTTYR